MIIIDILQINEYDQPAAVLQQKVVQRFTMEHLGVPYAMIHGISKMLMSYAECLVSRVVMFKSCLHVLPFTKALLPRNVFRVFSVLFLSMYILLSWKTRLWFCENSAVCFDASEPKGRPLSSSPKCFVIFSCVDALFEMISFRPKKKSLP